MWFGCICHVTYTVSRVTSPHLTTPLLWTHDTVKCPSIPTKNRSSTFRLLYTINTIKISSSSKYCYHIFYGSSKYIRCCFSFFFLLLPFLWILQWLLQQWVIPASAFSLMTSFLTSSISSSTKTSFSFSNLNSWNWISSNLTSLTFSTSYTSSLISFCLQLLLFIHFLL